MGDSFVMPHLPLPDTKIDLLDGERAACSVARPGLTHCAAALVLIAPRGPHRATALIDVRSIKIVETWR